MWVFKSRGQPAAHDAFLDQPMTKAGTVHQDAGVQEVKPLCTPVVIDRGVMNDVVHFLLVRQDGGFIFQQGDLFSSPMWHAVQPEETAVLIVVVIKLCGSVRLRLQSQGGTRPREPGRGCGPPPTCGPGKREARPWCPRSSMAFPRSGVEAGPMCRHVTSAGSVRA